MFFGLVADNHWGPTRKSSCEVPYYSAAHWRQQGRRTWTESISPPPSRRTDVLETGGVASRRAHLFVQFLFRINILLWDSEYCLSFCSHWVPLRWRTLQALHNSFFCKLCTRKQALLWKKRIYMSFTSCLNEAHISVLSATLSRPSIPKAKK